MSDVGQREIVTQKRVIRLFRDRLGYTYLGDWHERANNRNIEPDLLSNWLRRQGVSENLIGRALRKLNTAAALGAGRKLYDANKAVYSELRYGCKVKAGAGEQTETVQLIDWANPDNNDFGIAEEVSVQGELKKRPDLVLYVNGIALGIIELKRAKVGIEHGIRQNLDNQDKAFIRNFFTTMQLVMAGNDSQGLRYGTIQTREKYYLTWKEENPDYNPQRDERKQRYLPNSNCAEAESPLDCALLRVCNKARFLELIHNFIVFDKGTKKVPRHNQYFGVKAAQRRIAPHKGALSGGATAAPEGGIIWHTQGSGKSLTMVWLAKWIRENVHDARVLIVTDRTELDAQIEGVFIGIDEQIYRTTSGADLIDQLNATKPWLLCSLVHKFGRKNDDAATDDFVAALHKQLPSDFRAKGKLFIFVDECHRTQSGKLHTAMKEILPDALFIGFTGTPLLKTDKQKSVEVFGTYIHTYKFDEAIADGVVLDLRYEARDIDQYIRKPEKIDEWFDLATSGMSDMARVQLKQRWGTMQKVLSSRDRLQMIVNDIWKDMKRHPRLAEGQGNAMLVCASIYQACKVYEMFDKTDLKGRCAIITSYKPSPADIKLEGSGEGQTERLHQYDIYRGMLGDYFEEPPETAMYKVEEFERQVKERFINEPGQMKLMIVVDKLLTGFDAPSATYLYIDKQMRDHGLFQAICRVNRLDSEDKTYGYIVDYKDLFHSLEGAIGDYTSGALDGYDSADVAGLLSNRLDKARERLEDARETVKALCEPVAPPHSMGAYQHYFCAADTADKDALKDNEPKRVALYKEVASLLRAYASLANEMGVAGYGSAEIATIKQEVKHYNDVREVVKTTAGEHIDLKQYEPAMRHLIDTYIRADDSEKLTELEEYGLIELIVQRGESALDALPAAIKADPQAMAETIENNIRRVITDERPTNPKYYDDMSELLVSLIEQRREAALEYKEYMDQLVQMVDKVHPQGHSDDSRYPNSVDTRGKQAIYDTLKPDEGFVEELDHKIRITKKADWVGHRMKERELANMIREVAVKYEVDVTDVMGLIKEQDEYK